MASDSIIFKESHTEMADALRCTREEEIRRRAHELYLERRTTWPGTGGLASGRAWDNG
jgi:hypothetical protein